MSKNNFNQNNSKLSFDVQSNMIHDECYVDAYLKQTQGPGEYKTSNLRSTVCEAPKARDLSLSQANVNFTDGYGLSGINGCNIDVDSGLRNNPDALTNKKCIQTLNARPYLTVPFLGRGPSNPVLESKLMQGASILDKKSCKTITEKQLVNRDDDLVPSLKSTIQNPANLVEGVAANGWIRGGLPSRELTRDMDYFKRNK